MIMTTLISRSE